MVIRKINIGLTEELHQKLLQESKAQFRTRQSLVRQLINDMPSKFKKDDSETKSSDPCGSET